MIPHYRRIDPAAYPRCLPQWDGSQRLRCQSDQRDPSPGKFGVPGSAPHNAGCSEQACLVTQSGRAVDRHAAGASFRSVARFRPSGSVRTRRIGLLARAEDGNLVRPRLGCPQLLLANPLASSPRLTALEGVLLTTRSLRGMARVGSGQAPAWLLSSGQSVHRRHDCFPSWK
jgi:hypothetical protein